MGQVGTAVAERQQQVSPMAGIKHQLDRYRPVIEDLLEGTGTTVATFTAQIANAVRAVPDLLKCNPESVLGCALKSAQLGLAPNDTRNLCWILPYGGQAQWQLGYGGVLELARRAMPGLKFSGHPVYPNDEFDLDLGREHPVTHRPAAVLGRPRGGDAYLWYVLARYPDGSEQVGYLDREGVEYHRKFSKQPQGQMWTKSYDAAALKSVVSDMKRWLPSNPQIAIAYGADERSFDVRNQGDFTDADESPSAPALAAVPAANVDVETGEVNPQPQPPVETRPIGASEPPMAGSDRTPWQHIGDLAKAHGVTTDKDRYRMVSQILGRDIASAKDVNGGDALKVRNYLNGLEPDVPFVFRGGGEVPPASSPSLAFDEGAGS